MPVTQLCPFQLNTIDPSVFGDTHSFWFGPNEWEHAESEYFSAG